MGLRDGDTTGITVIGRGEVSVPPDLGFLTLGVQSTASTVAAARERAAGAASAVLAAVKANGVQPADIQTSGLSIQANHDYSKESQPITGYTVGNSVVAKVRAIETLSALVDAAIAAGGNDIRLNSINFGNEDETAAKDAARAAAMADAKRKAQQLASLGGVALGAPLSIEETTSAPPFQGMRMLKAAAMESAAMPVESGSNVISVEVSVRYAIA